MSFSREELIVSDPCREAGARAVAAKEAARVAATQYSDPEARAAATERLRPLAEVPETAPQFIGSIATSNSSY